MRQLESGCIPGRCVFFVLVLLIVFCICPPEPTLQLFSKKKYNEKSKFKNDEYMFTCTTTGSVTSRPVFQKEMFSYLCLIHHHHSCWPNYLSQFLLHYRVPENTNRKIIFVHQIVWIPYNIAHCTKHSRKNQLDPNLLFQNHPWMAYIPNHAAPGCWVRWGWWGWLYWGTGDLQHTIKTSTVIYSTFQYYKRPGIY